MAAQVQPRRDNSMLVRRFENPATGQTAVLEIPQGWSSNSFYRVTLYDKDGKADAPETFSFATPGEARSAAAARERASFSGGWRPKMAAVQRDEQRQQISLFKAADGSRIAGAVSVEINREIIEVPNGSPFMRGEPGATRVHVTVVCTDDLPAVRLNDRLLLKIISPHNTETRLAFHVAEISTSAGPDIFCDLRGLLSQVESCDEAAWARVSEKESREAIIEECLGDHPDGISEQWQLLAQRVPDRAERQVIMQEVIRRRADREAAARRTQDQEAARQREAAERAIRETAQRTARERQRSLLSAQQREQDQKDIEAARRRLSGGKELGAPKPRKIDLGE